MNLVIQNLKKEKKRVDILIESQKGAIDKFIKTNQKSKFENIGNWLLNE